MTRSTRAANERIHLTWPFLQLLILQSWKLYVEATKLVISWIVKEAIYGHYKPILAEIRSFEDFSILLSPS